MDLIDRASRYLAKCEPSVAGSGGHDACFKAAVALVQGFDLSEEDALGLLQKDFNPRCQPEWKPGELRHKVKSAGSAASTKPRGYLLNDRDRSDAKDWKAKGRSSRSSSRMPSVSLPAELPPAVFSPEILAARVKRLADRNIVLSTEWLANRSRVDPFACGPEMFLDALARDGEKFCVLVDGSKGKGDFLFDASSASGSIVPLQESWGVDSVGERVCELSRGAALEMFPAAALDSPGGSVFLCQPVNGVPTLNAEGEPSWRSEPNVTAWRYMVLETDIKGIAPQWMAFLVQLEEAIEAIYTSGGKSIHALVRVDAGAKVEWDAMKERYKRQLVAYGADPCALSAVRLTRLPGMRRGGKLQKLLYFNPRASRTAIADLDVKWSMSERYRGNVSALNYYRINGGQSK